MPPLLIGAVEVLTNPVRGVVPRAVVLLVGDRECVVSQRRGVYDHSTGGVSVCGVRLLAAIVSSQTVGEVQIAG